jgi:serine/threonine protein kinase
MLPQVFTQISKQLFSFGDFDYELLFDILIVMIEGETNPDHLLWLGCVGLAFVEEYNFGAEVAVHAFSKIPDDSYLRYVKSVIEVRRNDRAARLLNEISHTRGDSSLLCASFNPWDVPNFSPGVSRSKVDAWLTENKAVRLHTYSEPEYTGSNQRNVILISIGGELLLLKEVFDDSAGPLDLNNDFEHTILERLVGIRGVPLVKSIVSIGDKMFIVRQVISNPTLRDTELDVNKPGDTLATLRVLARLSRTFARVHERGVAVLDIKPSNVLLNGGLFDFSHSRYVGENEIGTFITNSRHVAPEVLFRRKATTATDVFSFGVMAFTALTGKHPFPVVEEAADGTRLGSLLRYSLANGISDPLRKHLCSVRLKKSTFDLLEATLSKNPGDRPTMSALAEHLDEYSNSKTQLRVVNKFDDTAMEKQSNRRVALLPMSASIPHVGHVSLIARCLDLGFRVCVVMQQAFLLHDKHPLPAYLSARMILAELATMGYTSDNVVFRYNDFVAQSEHLLRFLMIPEWSDVAVIVSGNPDVRDLLAQISEGIPFVDPRDLFHDDLPLANGTVLRSLVSSDDYMDHLKSIDAMCTPAMRRVCSLAKIRSWIKRSNTNPIYHVTGKNYVQLNNGTPVRLLNWEGPEEAVLRCLRASDPLVSLFRTNSDFDRLNFAGVPHVITLVSVELIKDDLMIHYSLVPLVSEA